MELKTNKILRTTIAKNFPALKNQTSTNQPSDIPFYSLLKLFTGFINAAFID